MKVLVIHCLPNEMSFTRKLKNAFLSGLRKNGHQIEEIDLVARHFDPLLNLPATGEVLEVIEMQNKISTADILVFAYPTWWFGMPALMKGFFDRIFTVGFAFQNQGNKNHGLLKNIKATYLISSMRSSFWTEFFNCYAARSFYANFKGIMHYCGIRKIRRIQAYNLTKNTPNLLAQKYISLAKSTGLNFKKK